MTGTGARANAHCWQWNSSDVHRIKKKQPDVVSFYKLFSIFNYAVISYFSFQTMQCALVMVNGSGQHSVFLLLFLLITFLSNANLQDKGTWYFFIFIFLLTDLCERRDLVAFRPCPHFIDSKFIQPNK